jgi:hypothetical protein
LLDDIDKNATATAVEAVAVLLHAATWDACGGPESG